MGNWKPEKVLPRAHTKSKNRNLKYSMAMTVAMTLRPLNGCGVMALIRVLVISCMRDILISCCLFFIATCPMRMCLRASSACFLLFEAYLSVVSEMCRCGSGVTIVVVLCFCHYAGLLSSGASAVCDVAVAWRIVFVGWRCGQYCRRDFSAIL